MCEQTCAAILAMAFLAVANISTTIIAALIIRAEIHVMAFLAGTVPATAFLAGVTPAMANIVFMAKFCMGERLIFVSYGWHHCQFARKGNK